MARDLIPPPSPAGRPEQPGGGSTESPPPRRWLSGGETALQVEERAERREDAPQTAQELPRLAHDSPYRPRFGFLFGALIGVAIAACAVAFALVAGGDAGAPEGWSKWRPESDERLAAAEEIAAHVARKYRHESGEQLVLVSAGDVEMRDLPLEVAIRHSPAAGDIDMVEGDGVMYTLTGLGLLGSIDKGRPSVERGLLLRREALELALYTFRYAKDVDLVVTLLPPPPPKKDQTLEEAVRENPVPALLFRPGDLEAQLDAPTMQVTVPEDRTPRPETVDDEAPRIDALTRSSLFLASVRQAQDAQWYLVLDPPRRP